MKQQEINTEDIKKAMELLANIANNAQLFSSLAENMIGNLPADKQKEAKEILKGKDVKKAMDNLNGALNKMQDYGRKNR
jgi:ABC-type transport system involved in cytochrome bd biosynthesis fused ATPase/permease subunit